MKNLKLCKNIHCCGKYVFVAENDGVKTLIPLRKVHIDCRIAGSISSTTFELVYVNPDAQAPLECTYVFPLDKSAVMSDFKAVIGDREVHTKVADKVTAEEKYEDALAQGNTAVMAAQRTTSDALTDLTVKLGNLMPGEEASISYTLTSRLGVVAGHYCFSLPLAFYPDYRKHGVMRSDSDERFIYQFSYSVKIDSTTPISRLSLPQHANLAERNEDRTRLRIEADKPSRQILIYFQTADMFVPELLFAENEATGEVALSASFVPTFQPAGPLDTFEVVCDEKPF